VFLALGWFKPGHIDGICRYACETTWTLGRWWFDIRGLLPQAKDTLRQFAPQGIISQLRGDLTDLVKAVEVEGVPTVELCWASGMRVPRVIPDEEAAGALAAAHLHERGFSRFVYIGYQDQAGCLQGFSRTVRAGGGTLRLIDLADPPVQRETGEPALASGIVHDEQSPLRRDWVRRFFSCCDKPVGVCVTSPTWAADIIEGCRKAHILVPEQVAVISMADMLGEGAAWPVPLTVIAPNYEEQGYQAAQLLDRMMKGEQVPPDTVVKVPPKGLVPRDSTRCRATGNLPIARAITFIMRNLHDPALNSRSVCRAAQISRSRFYRSFTQHAKAPVAQYIEQQRLKEAVTLLASTTDLPRTIAEQCGFGDPLRFRRALVRTTGMSPLAYRRKHRKTKAG